jgi:hypothetical protein
MSARARHKTLLFKPTGLLGAHLYAFVKLKNITTLCRSGAAGAARQEPALATPNKQKRGEWLWGGVRKPYTAKPL